MKKIRLIYRLFFFLLCVFTLATSSTLMALLIRNKVKRQKIVSSLIKFLSKNLMRVMGVKIEAKGLEHLKKKENYLIVSNHVSYTDITLIHLFIKNNRFITHYEWQENNPFLNLIITKAGVYFIERRNLKNIRKELRDATNILKQGLHLVFFPEGTSTDGSKILPFHPPFFATAIQAQKAVLPICINYKKVNNTPLTAKNYNLICWYDPQVSFLTHLLKVLQFKSIEAEILFLPPINTEGKNSRNLAIESREQIIKYASFLKHN